MLFCLDLLFVTVFFFLFFKILQKPWKKEILNSFWSAQHPKAGQNMQHWVNSPSPMALSSVTIVTKQVCNLFQNGTLSKPVEQPYLGSKLKKKGCEKVGHDEKRSLQSTTKTAVVNVDHRHWPYCSFHSSLRRPLHFSNGQHLPLKKCSFFPRARRFILIQGGHSIFNHW